MAIIWECTLVQISLLNCERKVIMTKPNGGLMIIDFHVDYVDTQDIYIYTNIKYLRDYEIQ